MTPRRGNASATWGGGGLLGEFFEWWGGQLRSLVPARLARPAVGEDALIADVSQPDVLAIRRRRRGVEQRVAQLRADDTGTPGLRAAINGRQRGEPVVLRVPPAWVLERNVSLPLAAERDLSRVLGYEMERLTPFTADELVWGHSVQLRDRVRGRIGLRLSMVPRSAVEPSLQLLRGQDAMPHAIEAVLPDGTRVLKLVRAATGRSGPIPTNLLAAAAAAAALAALASPFLRQSLQLADLHQQMDIMAPRIAQVDALRKRINGSTAGGDAVAAETRRLGDTLEALAAVTEILPDDSYLTEFTMRERKMTLAGLGASAPRLISALSADPRIRNPAFTAPVTRSETNHNDVFAIRAELAP